MGRRRRREAIAGGRLTRAGSRRRASPPRLIRHVSQTDVKTYGVKDEEGRVVAFEVPNFLVGRRGVCRIVRTISGVRLIKEPRRWRLVADDEFCEFEVEGVRFVAFEPFGDSSRYWIGPKPPGWVAGLERVREAFARAAPVAPGLGEMVRTFLGYRRTG